MRNIRRVILTSMAAVAFTGMMVATSHAASYFDTPMSGQFVGEPGVGQVNPHTPDTGSTPYSAPGGYVDESTTSSGTSSYQSGSQSGSYQYSGQGTGGFTGSQNPCCNQNPCYQGGSMGTGGQVGAGIGGAQVGAGAGGSTGYQSESYSQGQIYNQGQAYDQSQRNLGAGAQVGAGAGGTQVGAGMGAGGSTGYDQSGTFQRGQATGGYQGQTFNNCCCPGTSSMSSGSSPGGPADYQQAYRSSQFAGGQQQNFNQSPCFTGGSSMGAGTGGYTGYQQQNWQQSPQTFQQQPAYQQGTGYQQNYQSGTFQGQGAGGTQTPCCNPCCQGSSMGTGSGGMTSSGMTGTTDMRSGNYNRSQQWQQRDMRSGGSGMSSGTGGPCNYTYGSGAGGSMGRDFYGTGFHSWVERW